MKLDQVHFISNVCPPGSSMFVVQLRAANGLELTRVGDAIRARDGEAERYYPLTNVRSFDAAQNDQERPSRPGHSAQNEHSAAQCVQCGAILPQTARGEHCSKSCAARTREQRRASGS